MGVPFLPARSLQGTDTYKHSAAKKIECPFSGLPLAAIPALSPDVAGIHVHEADCYGNCRIRGTSVADCETARASKHVIISCERIIPNSEIRKDPTLTVIPYYCVDAVCEVPYGSFPGNMPYEYYSDEEHIRQWLTVEQDEEEHLAFLDKYLFGVNDFSEYIELCGGAERMNYLRQLELNPKESE